MVVESIQYGPHFEKSLYGGFGGICGSMRGIINTFFCADENALWGPFHLDSLFQRICSAARKTVEGQQGKRYTACATMALGWGCWKKIILLSTLDPTCQDKLRRHSLQTSRNLNQVSRAHDTFCSPPSEGPFIFAALQVGPPFFVLFCFVKWSNNLAVFSRNLLKSLEALSQP